MGNIMGKFKELFILNLTDDMTSHMFDNKVTILTLLLCI